MRAFDTWYVDVNKLGGFMRGVYSLDYETHSHPYWSCIFDYFVKKCLTRNVMKPKNLNLMRDVLLVFCLILLLFLFLFEYRSTTDNNLIRQFNTMAWCYSFVRQCVLSSYLYVRQSNFIFYLSFFFDVAHTELEINECKW